MKKKMAGGVVIAVFLGVPGFGNLLPNGGFIEGDKTPAGWKLSGGQGEWLRDQDEGMGSLKVTGDGKDSNVWISSPVEFVPNRVYRLSFGVRGEDAGGGTVISGPDFANVDIGVPGREWTFHNNVFAVPARKEGFAAGVRLGQWHLKGSALFTRAMLEEVEPVHRSFGELRLGAGERLDGVRYSFDAPLRSELRNHSRPLAGFTARFNSDRWCFAEGQGVTYRHTLAGRRLRSGQVDVTCGYYVAGRLPVEVSADRKEWRMIGVVTNASTQKLMLPAEMFPVEAVYVRLRGANSPCNLQVHSYRFEGEVDGEPLQAKGSTQYVVTESKVPRLDVKVRGLGDAVPGGENVVDLRVHNQTGAMFEAALKVVFSRLDGEAHTNSVPVSLPPGAADVRVPYAPPSVGIWEMALELGDAFRARSRVAVPDFYDDSYGERLPSGNPEVVLWRASSGWKIPRSRALPRRSAKGLALRLAGNEREAVQLVVTPATGLTNVMVKAGGLVCGKHNIPAGNVSVLRVGYVPVTQTTDSTGVVADWPDPLLPQDEPVNLEAGRNQPYWIRVSVPPDLPAGIYHGEVTVEADGLKVAVPMSVEVFGFSLPDTLTCETAFGFSLTRALRYHGVDDLADKRTILDKYLRALADNRISPYNPAPLDGWSVKWKGMNPWRGGVIVTDEKAEGNGSLFINDDSETANVAAVYPHAVNVPKNGFKIKFKHKTTKGQKTLFSLNHQKADGAWMPGRNHDITVQGSKEWQVFETVVKTFPPEAASARFAVYAAGYQEPGTETGGLWLDALSITDLDTGGEVVEGGDFEPLDINVLEPVFDWTAWDAAMERAFTEYHFNSFQMRVEGLGGGTYHGRYEPSFLGYKGGTPEYDILMGKYLKGIESHLREKGWLDKAYVYWFDEPDPKDYEFVMRGFETLKRHAPGLRRMLTEQVEQELIGGPDLWCPLTPSLNVAGLEERRAAGDQFWWYVCCVPKAPYVTEFIDHPGTEMRVWLWQTWAERVTGILVWETVYWTSDAAYPDRSAPQNPYLDPMSWVSGYATSAGTKRPWGNGDGRFLYPPLAAADGRTQVPVLAGPVSSFRIEMLRDGLEDYEYFVILKRLLEQKGDKIGGRERSRMEALLKVPAEVSTGLTNFTRDPAPIEAHRERLARTIVTLQKQ